MEPEETKPCRFCRSMVSVNAIKCPFCNEILHAGYREHLASMQSEKRDSSRDGTAAILSLFVPGMGHIIKGYAGNGVLWFMICGFLLLLSCSGAWPALIMLLLLWAWLVDRAYKIDPA